MRRIYPWQILSPSPDDSSSHLENVGSVPQEGPKPKTAAGRPDIWLEPLLHAPAPPGK